jgi:long-chain acyl-CoA synthetase
MAILHLLGNDSLDAGRADTPSPAIRCERGTATMIHTHSLGRAARHFADMPALASGGTHSTFRELRERVANIAGALHGHGFVAGDRLALLLPNEREYIELIYACAWLGLIAVPLNTRLSPVELDHVLSDASPRGLIRHSSLPVPTVQLPWHKVIDREPWDVPSNPGGDPIYDPEAILALIYTSGTTGRPKGVALSHASVLENVHIFNYWMPYREGAVFFHAAPMFHIIDFPLLFAAPAFGTCQVTIPKFSAQNFCEAVERERVTHTVLVPTMLNLLTQYPELENYDLTSLERIAYGGSPMAPELIHRIRTVLPHVKLMQGYGLSETGFLTALLDEEHTPDRITSCGRPYPGIDVRVVDQSGTEVSAGQPGELVARGANVMRGYWKNPEETTLAFRDGFFRTGDVGRQDADGYFYILDRLKDMIVTGGENVYSGEVEAVLYEHPAVREAAVFGIPDPKWGELVMACVVLKPGAVLSANDLTAYCRRSLANYKLPRRIEFSSAELPKNGSGKILKRTLREHYWSNQKRAVS